MFIESCSLSLKFQAMITVTKGHKLTMLINIVLNLLGSIVSGIFVCSIFLAEEAEFNIKAAIFIILYITQQFLYFYPTFNMFLDMIVVQTIRGTGQLFQAWSNQMKADCVRMKSGALNLRG